MTFRVIRAIISIFAFTAASISILAFPNVRLDPVDYGSLHLNKLDWHSIPALVVPDAKRGQVFVLRASGMPDLTIVPVRYQKARIDKDPNPVSLRCGVYLLPQGGTESFVKVIPTEVYPSWCTGINAVGKMPDFGPRPRLIFSFYSSTEGNHKASVEFVLSWNKEKSMYQMDEPQSEWLLNEPYAHGPGGIIERVRRTLAHYHPGQEGKNDE